MNETFNIKEELEKEGWSLASVAGDEHLRRILEMYEELGIEVHLEETKPEECEGCTECYRLGNETIYEVYTRAKVKHLGEQHDRED